MLAREEKEAESLLTVSAADMQHDAVLGDSDSDGSYQPRLGRQLRGYRQHESSMASMSAAYSRPCLLAVCGGCVGGVVAFLLLLLSPRSLPFAHSSVFHSPFGSASPTSSILPADASFRLAPNWVPGYQPRLQQRMQWLDDVLPLDELYRLRADPDAAPLQSSVHNTADPLAASLRAFFANYTRFHARSMRSLGPDTKFLICRALPYKDQGLGNRLLAVASGLLLAALTERVFILDWTRCSDDFDIGDILDTPPFDWRLAPLEQHYGAEAVKAAEGQAGNIIHFNENYEQCKADYERLLCGDLEQWRGNASAQFVTLDSSQFFAPLLWHNPLTRAQLERWGFSNGQLSVWLFRYLFHPSAVVRQRMNDFKAQHWRPYMVGVQLRTRDGHATSTAITSLCYRCALLLTDALPRAWKENDEVGWFLATDDDNKLLVGQQILRSYAAAANVPAPQLVYAACPAAVQNETAAVAKMRCAAMHMALLGEVDDLVASKASSFGDVGHALSALAPMTLTEHLTCTRQPLTDACFHHWHYVRRLQCFRPRDIRGAAMEDINGRCVGDGRHWSDAG